MSGQKKVESGQKGGIVYQDSIRDYQIGALIAFLRQEHPIKTAEAVHAVTGDSVATVRKWLAGEAFPNGFAMLRLYRAYGLRLWVRFDPEPSSDVQLALSISRRRHLETELAAMPASPF